MQTYETSSLEGKRVLIFGGSSGIGRATAFLAHQKGARLVLAARDLEKLERVQKELGAGVEIAPLDVSDEAAVKSYFASLDPVDHIMVTVGGPLYVTLAEMDFEQARDVVQTAIWGSMYIARYGSPRIRSGGSLTLMTGSGIHRPGIGFSLGQVVGRGIEALTENFALELAPIRVNALAPGFVDTPLSAFILGEGLQARRDELTRILPIHRVIQPEDVAFLAVHVMENSVLSGSILTLDGGQRLIS
jgi:NAD(P)-dependent dehydrogenase (short-subunit alcohol dehydrogenase family)